MEYLHENKEEFLNAVNLASQYSHMLPIAVEKDYYVTMILKALSECLDYVVFKGGTSLSKCHRAIRRFSEDIDITIDSKITQGQMKKLKRTIENIAVELKLSIPNIDSTRSRRSYNCYSLKYPSVIFKPEDALETGVLLETSFAEISFPTVILPVHSYIGDMMLLEAPDKVATYGLAPFEMKVQGIDRTLIDKVFAICDYYLQDKVKKHSRHIYDIYKLLQLVPLTTGFETLVDEVRKVRSETNICPSAKEGVNIPLLLGEIIENEVYKEDYETITLRILEEDVNYDTAIEAVKKLSLSGTFG